MSKKVVVAAAGAVAAVGVAIGWKASRGRPRSTAEQGSETRKPFLIDDIDEERFLASLREAIRCRTVVFDDGTYDTDAFDALGEMLVERYPRVHAELDRETFNGHSLLYTWVGSDPRLDPIVLMAHQDVVPVEEDTETQWAAPPFAGATLDGRIYGRGSLDCKGPLIAIFEAVEFLLEQGAEPVRTVYIVSGHDEEVGGENGARVIAEELSSRGVSPWFVLDEGGAVADGVLPAVVAPIALVGIAEKGSMSLKLTAHGEGGHSSIPPRDSAIVRLAGAIAALDASPVPARIDALTPLLDALSDHLPGVLGVLAAKPRAAASLLSRVFTRDVQMDALQRTTMVPTIIEGGVKANVVPQAASVTLNVRIIPGDTSQSVIEHVRSVVGEEIDVEVLAGSSTEASGFSSIDSEGWETLTGVIGEVFPDAIVAPYVLTVATDSRFFEGLSDDVYRFSPFVVDAAALRGLHGTDEFIRTGDARRAVTFFSRLIAVAARMGDSP